MILLFFSITGLHAGSQTTKAEKLEQLRKALRSGGSEESATPRHPPLKSEKVDMQSRALDELKLNSSAYSESATPSVAVVRTQSIIAKDPVYYSGLQIGLNVQPYSAQGIAPLVTLGPRDLSVAEPSYMFGFEARYMPWMSVLLGEHSVGFRMGASYARQALNLYAPTGVRLGDSNVHSLQSYAFLSQEWVLPRAKYWSMNADLGVSRFDMLLTSSSTLGEASDNIWLGTLRLGPSFRSGDLSFNLNYERRERLTEGWARLAEDGIILGILYGIR